MKVYLDPGHGYDTPGKRSPDSSLMEYEFNQVVADLAEKLLLSQGFEVKVTKRMSEKDLGLTERCNLANAWGADIFISIHANAASNAWSSAKGWEVYSYPGSTSGAKFAKLAEQNGYPEVAKFGVTSRGCKTDNLAVLRGTKMPAILFEWAFFTNKEECELLKRQDYRNACALGVAKTACAWFGKTYTTSNSSTPPTTTPSNPVTTVPVGLTKEKYASTDIQILKLAKGSYNLKLVWAKGKKVSQLVKENNADYGFNFPFFWDGNPVSDTKIGSKILANPTTGKTVVWNGLEFVNGNVKIGKVNITDNLGTDGFLVKTSPLLVESGQNVVDKYVSIDQTASDIATTKCQRTAVGLDKNGNLLVVVTDGREGANNVGLGLKDLSEYMKSKGAITALNGDGGGSSVLANKSGVLIGNVGADERAVNHAVLVFLNSSSTTPTTPTTPATPTPITKGTAIKGSSVILDGNAIDAYIKKNNPNAPAVGKFYLSLGAQLGIRGDIAVAQAIKETGWFKFGGDVTADQNNFCGLGTTGGGVKGASFATVEEGVLAHLQHLYAYTTTAALPNGMKVVDPRFSIVQSLKKNAVYFEELGGQWAVPGFDKNKYTSFDDAYKANATYGQEIITMFEKMKASVGTAAPASKTPVQKNVLYTQTNVENAKILSVVIDNKGFVRVSDIANVFGKKALYDNVTGELTIVNVASAKTTPEAPGNKKTIKNNVVFTVANYDGKSFEAVVIDGKGFVRVTDMAVALGYTAKFDNLKQEIVFVK